MKLVWYDDTRYTELPSNHEQCLVCNFQPPVLVCRSSHDELIPCPLYGHLSMGLTGCWIVTQAINTILNTIVSCVGQHLGYLRSEMIYVSTMTTWSDRLHTLYTNINNKHTSTDKPVWKPPEEAWNVIPVDRWYVDQAAASAVLVLIGLPWAEKSDENKYGGERYSV